MFILGVIKRGESVTPEGAGALKFACDDAGVSGSIRGLVYIETADNSFSLRSFNYYHGTTLVFGNTIGGDGDIGSYNAQGTIANARKTVVYVLNKYSGA